MTEAVGSLSNIDLTALGEEILLWVPQEQFLSNKSICLPATPFPYLPKKSSQKQKRILIWFSMTVVLLCIPKIRGGTW